MTQIKIITPSGMFGTSADDTMLDTAMRVIGVAFAQPDEWASKYGTNYENDVFVMRTQYWGDCTCGAMETEVDCDPICPMVLPNFKHKASGFEVEWYKYIGRGMETRGTPPDDLMQQVFASHPSGMTLDDALAMFERQEEESVAAFRKMVASLETEATEE